MIEIFCIRDCRPCERLKNALARENVPYVAISADDCGTGQRMAAERGLEDGPYPAVFVDGSQLPPMTTGQYVRSLKGRR